MTFHVGTGSAFPMRTYRDLDDELSASTNSPWTGVARTGIYYLNRDAKPNGAIEFFDFTNHETTSVLFLEKVSPNFGGLAVSADGRSLLYVQNQYDDSNIMLVKNFRQC